MKIVFRRRIFYEIETDLRSDAIQLSCDSSICVIVEQPEMIKDRYQCLKRFRLSYSRPLIALNSCIARDPIGRPGPGLEAVDMLTATKSKE